MTPHIFRFLYLQCVLIIFYILTENIRFFFYFKVCRITRHIKLSSLNVKCVIIHDDNDLDWQPAWYANTTLHVQCRHASATANWMYSYWIYRRYAHCYSATQCRALVYYLHEGNITCIRHTVLYIKNISVILYKYWRTQTSPVILPKIV